jgi:hypothetical protein
MAAKPIIGWDIGSEDHTSFSVWRGASHIATLPPECGIILSMTQTDDDTLIVDCQFAVVTLDLSQSPPGIKVEMLPS